MYCGLWWFSVWYSVLVFNASIFITLMFCKHLQNFKFNAASLCQLYTFVSYIHSILLIVKLLSALWQLLHKILNTVMKFFKTWQLLTISLCQNKIQWNLDNSKAKGPNSFVNNLSMIIYATPLCLNFKGFLSL